MDIKIKCVGFWGADEVGALLEEEFGFSSEVSTSDGEVIVHPRPRVLVAAEIEWLREYLTVHPQKSSEERMVEFEVAEKTRRRELSDRVRKVTKSSEVAVKPKDLKDAIQALAEAAGIEL